MSNHWKTVPGYEGLYEVSNIGLVRRVTSGKILKASRSDKNPYLVVSLCKGGIPKTFAVHVLVALAWVGPRPSLKHEVRHSNGKRLDNRSTNLLWGTRWENRDDGKRLGEFQVGEARFNSKLRKRDIPKIFKMRDNGHSQRKIAAHFGVTQYPIWQVLTGRTWRHAR